MTGARVGNAFAVEAAGIGWKLYSRTRHYAADEAEPVGGTCVDIIDDTRTDPETGEILTRRYYRCLDWRKQWQTLDATEIDVDQLYGLDRNACWAGVRAMIKQFRLDRLRPAHRPRNRRPPLRLATRTSRPMTAAEHWRRS